MGNRPTQLVTYSYDAFGNRIQRQGWDGSTTTTQRYGLDGWDTAQPDAIGNENFDTWAVLDGSNGLASRNLSDPDFGAPVAVETAAGAVSWYATDLQGSVRTVLDNSGSVTSSVTFDAWGNVTSGALTVRYGFQGGEWDPTARLYRFGVRYYDPLVGTWYSEDPIRFAAGDSNLRRYVGNAPTNWVDTSGLQPRPKPGQTPEQYIASLGPLYTNPDPTLYINALWGRRGAYDLYTNYGTHYHGPKPNMGEDFTYALGAVVVPPIKSTYNTGRFSGNRRTPPMTRTSNRPTRTCGGS